MYLVEQPKTVHPSSQIPVFQEEDYFLVQNQVQHEYVRHRPVPALHNSDHSNPKGRCR